MKSTACNRRALKESLSFTIGCLIACRCELVDFCTRVLTNLPQGLAVNTPHPSPHLHPYPDLDIYLAYGNSCFSHRCLECGGHDPTSPACESEEQQPRPLDTSANPSTQRVCLHWCCWWCGTLLVHWWGCFCCCFLTKPMHYNVFAVIRKQRL